MGVIAQYQVSQANPAVVGGTGLTIKYFGSNPVRPAWLAGQPGINTPADSAQLGGTPSSSNATGQLSFDSVAQKLTGGRFRIYASGVASSATNPTVQPAIQINTGTIASPSYASLFVFPASAALTASKPLAFSLALDLMFDPSSATLSGFAKYAYASASGGTGGAAAADAAITAVTALTAGGIYATQFGLVVGVTFGTTSDPSNSASLYEFKIVED